MWIITHLCDIEYPFWEFGDKEESSEGYPDYIVKEEIKNSKMKMDNCNMIRIVQVRFIEKFRNIMHLIMKIIY